MKRSSIRASIDIGTNSVLLLIAEMTEQGLTILHEKQEIPRLGRGVDQNRNLHPKSRSRVLEVLVKYKMFLNKNYPEAANRTVLTATSAVRDSSNRDEFLKQIYAETGWSVRLLSGDEEAQTTYAGAVSVLNKRDHKFAVIDIGGGSTEVAIGERENFTTGISYDMGSVRFSERYFSQDPPTKKELDAARSEIINVLGKNKLDVRSTKLIGVAGTVTSAAAIILNLEEYDADAVNGFILEREMVSDFICEFSDMKSHDIEQKYAPFLTGRGDVITGGLLILDEFMKYYKFSELIVSTGGIRHGILLENK